MAGLLFLVYAETNYSLTSNQCKIKKKAKES